MDLPTDNQTRPKAATRLLQSVKRTLTPTAPRKRHPDCSMQKTAIHSTNAESRVVSSRQHFRTPDPATVRPTVEQIAMGLHISRTPHLRPLASPQYPFSEQNTAPHSASPYDHRTTPKLLPAPPPSRSSLKKAPASTTVTSSSSSPAVSSPFSNASASSTTVTSMTPSSARSPRSFAAIKFRMARFLPHNRSTSAPSSMMSSPVSSPRTSTSDVPVPPKKAVRFTTDGLLND